MKIKKRVLNSDKVLSAAVKMVKEKGLDNLSMQELSASLNVKPASLYNHISGIDEARLYVVRFSLEELGSVIRDSAFGYSGDEALRRIAHAYRHFGKNRQELYKAFINCINYDDTGVDKAKISIVQIFNQVLEPYQLNHEEKIHFTRCLRSSLHGFISLENTGFFKNKVDINKTFEVMIENLLIMLNNISLNKVNK